MALVYALFCFCDLGNMSYATNSSSVSPSFKALLPLFLFLALFIGTGVYMTLQEVEMAFYQLPAPVAALPAVVLGIVLSKDKLNAAIEQFLRGVGHTDIIAMCIIYLLAGAFAAVASATGGVEATVNLGLTMIPTALILPGIFIISAFIATSMGTSMGTIAAVAPVALGIANAADMDVALTAGVVLSGAMFGDNLSIISDTTIAATRSQGCQMRDKFKENIRIALPAALFAIVLFGFNSKASQVPSVEAVDWIKVIPYLTILVLAVSGVNVFVVLSLGIVLAGAIGFVSVSEYSVSGFANDIYTGFGNMQEIFLLSMLIGGISALMKEQGGLAYITQRVSRMIRGHKNSQRGAEMGIASVVSLTNLCTANNTVSIIVAGGVAKELAEENKVPAKRSASLLDIYSCVIQGVLPYGAQILLLGSIFGLSPLAVVANSYYCFFLAIAAALTIIFGKR